MSKKKAATRGRMTIDQRIAKLDERKSKLTIQKQIQDLRNSLKPKK